MMTLNPAASLDYYLATAADAEGMPLLDGEADPQRVGYYHTKHDADPLARPGRWFGRMADSFGLVPGSAVDTRTFANLYFGKNPDGKTTLTDDMPSIREQTAASRAKAKAEAELAAAGQALSDARVKARLKGADIERDPGVLLARERLDKAKRERRSVSGEAGTRQPAHDLAFGAPKDVSLLLMALHAEGRTEEARRIEDAFRRSVEQTLEKIERDFLLDRPRDGEGNRTIQGIAGCAGALFLHFDARPVDGATDPHLHAHALIFSPVATLDGEVRAVWTKYLSDHQHVLGAMQRALFAGGLKALGYDIEPDIQKKVASFRLQGLDDRQRAGFSKRSLQVQAALREGLTGGKAKRKNRATKFKRLSGRDLIGQTADRLRELGLDANAIASPQLETRLRRQIVQRMHREQQEELRGGLTPRVRVPGTPQWDAQVERRLADELRRLREPIPETPEAILESCLDMEACFSVRDIERRIWEAAAHADITPGVGETAETATLRWGREMLETILTHPDLLRVQYEGKGSGPQGLDPVGQPVFTTRKQRERETEVYVSVLPELASANDFHHINEDVADRRISEWETTQANRGKPIRLSDNQRQAITDLVTSSACLHVVSAWAGTGKTTMANAAVSIMRDMGLDVLAVAPSNAAAEGLRREIGAASALTPEAFQLGLANGTVKLTDKSVLYVDEASMLDFKETRAMLLAVWETGARIIFQGDARQLQAVGMGNVLKRILSMPECQLGQRPRRVSHLTQGFADFANIQRQRQTWAKQVVARAELGHVTRAFDELDRRGLVERHAGEEDTLRAAVRSYAADPGSGRLPADIDRFHRSRVMIASTNTRVARLNELAREELKAQGLLGGQDWLVAASKGRCLRVAIGERLIFTDKAGHGDVRIGDGGKQRVVKSAMGTVTAVTMRRGEPVLTLALDDGRKVEVDPRHFGGLDHAYALTVHKSQGMSVDRVEFVGGTFNSAELMLVALSRFKEKLTVHVAEHEVEAVRNSCARVTEKLEANDLHAIDLGFGTGANANAFMKFTKEAQGRLSSLDERLGAIPDRRRQSEQDAQPFSLPGAIRQRAWHSIESSLADPAVLAVLRTELGLLDAAAAKQRWAGKAADIIDWQSEDGGGKAFEVGKRNERGETELRGVVLADDGDRVYLAVAIHGNSGGADAHTRILAFGKEALGMQNQKPLGSSITVAVTNAIQREINRHTVDRLANSSPRR